MSSELLRKAVHFVLAFSFIVLAELFQQKHVLVICVVLLLVFVLLRKTSFTKYVHNVSRVSYGEFFFILGVMVSLLVSKGVVREFQLAMMILAFADPFASLFGMYYGTHEYCVQGEVRTYEGSVVCGVISMFVFLLFGYSVFFAGVAGVTLACVEALSVKGSDNFFLPVSTVILAFFFS